MRSNKIDRNINAYKGEESWKIDMHNVNHLVRTPSILWVKEGVYPYYKESINARPVEGSSTRGGINKSKGADGEPTILREFFGLWSLCKLKCK